MGEHEGELGGARVHLADVRDAFAGYLEKPIDIAEFPAHVRSYCRHSPG